METGLKSIFRYASQTNAFLCRKKSFAYFQPAIVHFACLVTGALRNRRDDSPNRLTAFIYRKLTIKF